MKNKKIILLLIFIIVSCNNKQEKNLNKYAKIAINKEYNFGTISANDTVSHVFKVKNISNIPLKITEVGTSCGCTVAVISDSIAKKNEYAKVKVTFISDINKLGNVKKSVVLLANTNPPYTSFYIKGVVEK